MVYFIYIFTFGIWYLHSLTNRWQIVYVYTLIYLLSLGLRIALLFLFTALTIVISGGVCRILPAAT